MVVRLESVAEALEMWLKLLKKPEPFVDPNLDPVLLVPGIAGSILEAVDADGRTDRVWVRIFGADSKFRNKLWSRFDPQTGKTLSLDPRYGLYAIDVLDPDVIIGRESFYYFHDMITEMIKWGYQEGKTLFGFGYDFRQSNRLKETMDHFAEKLEAVYTASGGKRINLISHSMGGILVKCFMSLHADVFEKYVQNWIAISAPFQGAPGYVTSALLNGCSFVDGWEQNLFISKWSMHQLASAMVFPRGHRVLYSLSSNVLIECPSIYELMGCHKFNWQHHPNLEIWRERNDNDGNSCVLLESYSQEESLTIFKQSLSNNTVEYVGESIPLPFNTDILRWANETKEILSHAVVPPSVKFYNIYGTSLETPHSVCYGSEISPVVDLQQLRYCEAKYICVDGDGTVPVESAKADGLKAEARVGVPAEHRGILSEHHVFRVLQHWLKAGKPDPFYDPLNDYVVLPTGFELEKITEKYVHITPWSEEWELISSTLDQDEIEANKKDPILISVSEESTMISVA